MERISSAAVRTGVLESLEEEFGLAYGFWSREAKVGLVAYN